MGGKSLTVNGLAGSGEVAGASMDGRQRHDSCPIASECLICNRNVRLDSYEFGLVPSVLNLTTGQLDVNPNYRKVWICSTDLKLLIEIRKKNPDFTPDKIVEIAKIARNLKPIQKSRGTTVEIKSNTSVVTFNGATYCTSCGNRMTTELVKGLQVTKCNNKLCSVNL